MQWKKILFATIVGIILFITDMKFGWISFALGGVWTLFIIVFIVGILAGGISGGFVAGILTEVLGVGIFALIPEMILNPGITIEATDILSRMWLVMALSLSYSTRFPDAPVPWIETLVIIILLILLAPLVYVMALIFGPLGGLIGKPIYSRIFKSEPAPVRAPSQEPRPSVPPPVDTQEEPITPDTEDETVEAEEETFDPNMEPSE
jgi:hypothetical protein